MQAEFNWQQVNSDLGPTHKPIVVVEILKKSGDWQKYVFKVDSGAVITFMGRPDCEFLGYDFEEGEDHTFFGANNTPIPCKVHTLELKIKKKIIPSRIAFAYTPITELLLGRFDVFTSIDIELQGRNLKTIFRW